MGSRLAASLLAALVLGGCSGPAAPASPPSASLSAAPSSSGSAAPPVSGSPSAASTRSQPASARASVPVAACGAALPSGDAWISLESDGVARQALVHVPPTAPGPQGYPAVIALHGYSAQAVSFASYSGLSAMSDRSGFVAVYPQGLGDTPEWHLAGGMSINPELSGTDHALGAALLAWLAGSGCVDMSRVFLTGHSQGGGMAADLACAMADRIAGVALVSAVYLRFPCQPVRPIPVVAFHALDDPVLPYGGGRVGGAPDDYPNVLPVENVLTQWADRDGCTSGPATAALEGGVDRLTWSGCRAPVILYRRPSGGHDWALANTDLLWTFFAGLPDLK